MSRWANDLREQLNFGLNFLTGTSNARDRARIPRWYFWRGIGYSMLALGFVGYDVLLLLSWMPRPTLGANLALFLSAVLSVFLAMGLLTVFISGIAATSGEEIPPPDAPEDW